MERNTRQAAVRLQAIAADQSALPTEALGVRSSGGDMTSSLEHLDRALAEEFAGHGETIHRLKTSDARFKLLMTQNHALWLQIQNMQSGVTPADDATRHELEKKRLKLLDEIGAIIRAAEG